MIRRANLDNPLRWYVVALVVGLVCSLLVNEPFAKFQIQRLTELFSALVILACCYRRSQSPAFFSQPVIGGWYGLGLLGCVLTSLLAGSFGSIPAVSLGFVGLVLLQFGLFPLIQLLWQRHGSDSVRMLALFAVVLIGIDVGILAVAHLGDLRPYAWILRLLPDRTIESFPYVFLNSRWANQVSLLVVWAFLPLLAQLRAGEIRRFRSYWWTVCMAIPSLAMVQFVFTAGRGVLLASLLALLALWVWMRSERGFVREVLRTAIVLVLASFGVALMLNLAFDHGSFFADVALRNAQELAPAAEGTDKRSVLWSSFARAIWGEGFQGMGIPFVPPDAPACTPHNLWLALVYWTGLIGTGFAVLLATGFVPRGLSAEGPQMMALPLLVSLFVYQLVDDIWLRSLSLAVLMVVLPALKQPASQDVLKAQPRLLQIFSFPASTYRLLALVGVLLISVSTVVPGGVGFGPSPLVSVPGRTCMLFF